MYLKYLYFKFSPAMRVECVLFGVHIVSVSTAVLYKSEEVACRQSDTSQGHNRLRRMSASTGENRNQLLQIRKRSGSERHRSQSLQ